MKHGILWSDEHDKQELVKEASSLRASSTCLGKQDITFRRSEFITLMSKAKYVFIQERTDFLT